MRRSSTKVWVTRKRRAGSGSVRACRYISKPPEVPRPRIAAGLNAITIPSRSPDAFCAIPPATFAADVSARWSQGLSGMKSVAALVLLPPPRRSKPTIPITVCTPGSFCAMPLTSAVSLRVRSSVAPSGSWMLPKT